MEWILILISRNSTAFFKELYQFGLRELSQNEKRSLRYQLLLAGKSLKALLNYKHKPLFIERKAISESRAKNPENQRVEESSGLRNHSQEAQQKFSSLKWYVPGLQNCYGVITIYLLTPPLLLFLDRTCLLRLSFLVFNSKCWKCEADN